MKLHQVVTDLLDRAESDWSFAATKRLLQGGLSFCRDLAGDLEVVDSFVFERIGPRPGSGACAVFLTSESLLEVTPERGIAIHLLREFERIEIQGTTIDLTISVNPHKAGQHRPMFEWQCLNPPEGVELMRLAKALVCIIHAE